MALRPMGVYLLTGTALRSQTRSAYHVAQMNRLATESASLSLAAAAELDASLALEGQSAVDSEEGVALQAESIELELAAELEFAKAAAETALGEEYEAEAEALREESAKDAAESEASLARAEKLELRAEELSSQAETDRAAAALDEEKSVALLEESAKASEIATGAEEKAAEYEALVLKREGRSIKDGEALLKAEAGAMEDAEAMAACMPIPFLNFVCEAVGTMIEAGYQGVAAFRGAKAAVETISAVAAQGKERSEWVLAAEQEEEAARLALEAERFQLLSEEESGKAAAEEGEISAAQVGAGETQLLGETKFDESEKEEALAAFDEERESEQFAKAAQDETIATEEESAAIDSELESEELLSKSASEEFQSLSERFDGEAKEAKAQNMMEKSVGHGMHALGFILHSVLTAGLVVYVVAMIGLIKVVFPGMTNVWSGDLTSTHVMEHLGGYIMHVGVVIGSIVSMPSLANLDDVPTHSKVKALFYLALMAGSIEAFVVHSIHKACCCCTKGMCMRSTLTKTMLTFLSKFIRLTPMVLVESLILAIMFRPTIFGTPFFSKLNPVWIWVALLVVITARVLALISMQTKPVLDQKSLESELEFLSAREEQKDSREPRSCDVDKEYGSMEEISLLSSLSSDGGGNISDTRRRPAPIFGSLWMAWDNMKNYFNHLRLLSDLLVLALMGMLLWNCWPLLRVLHPLATTSMGALASWASVPILIAAAAVVMVIFHFIFVH
ncbi:hypothetical protein ACHAWF_010579 [Thalassiosira exigua]